MRQQMADADSTLKVLFQDEPVADLRSLNMGNAELSYHEEVVLRHDGEYLLSVSLPVRKGTYGGPETRPFLEGLLPEGRLREQLCQRFGLDVSDVFGLLREIGRDCAGAISFLPTEEPSDETRGPSVDWLTEEDVVELIDELPLRPLGVDPPHGVRMSLAGAQNKLPVVIDAAGLIGLPRGQTPSTHILKPLSSERTGSGQPAYPGLVENEAFCLRLAAAIGLPAAKASVRRIGGSRVLVVERYDRVLRQNRAVRLHQEDLCQALGIPPARKYEEQGGPGVKDVFGLLRRVSTEAGRDILSFLERTAFSVGIANLDAHGKNIALLYADGIHLAPMYDVICTVVYPRLTGRLAMNIGGQFQADQVTPRHWSKLLDDASLNTVNARRRLAAVGERILVALGPTRAEARAQDFDHEILDQIERRVRERAERLTALAAYEPGQRRVATVRRPPTPLAGIPFVVDTKLRRFKDWLLLDVVNRGAADDFGAQLVTVDGAAPDRPVPIQLRWYDSGSDLARLLPGQNGALIVGRYHRNGLNYLKSGKWNIEPPFVLREEASPLGGSSSLIGIYPPSDIGQDELDAFRFRMVIRVSASSGYIDRTFSLGINARGEVKDLTDSAAERIAPREESESSRRL